MRICDAVANYIMELLEESDGYAEIQRNELANLIGCVPSQINYVITSRFTPEQGYIVESRRGGGGYIKIIRKKISKSSAIMHIINSIGERIDNVTCKIMTQNLAERGIISFDSAKLILCAVSDRVYVSVPAEIRDSLRAALFKNLLLTQL
ncbi:MAG: CtsR family transcriptional regulator [Clostridia bacterium]|nr:CtsR family transcriptional regulator [Clostridia bacterium]